MKRKAVGIYLTLLFLFGAAVRSICRTTGSPEYLAAAGGQSLYRLDVADSRGMIYDCELRPLLSGETRTVAAVNPTIETIGRLNLLTGGKKRERLAAALQDGRPFLLELDAAEAEALEDDPQVRLFQVPVRLSENQSAAHLIGTVDGAGRGVSGIELAMDDLLSAQGGQAWVSYEVDAMGRAMAGGVRQTVDTLRSDGSGAALTINREIQELAEEAGKELGKGAVVVAETPDCEVRALASFPGYSPADLAAAVEDSESPLLNRAFCAYPPGSVFKLAGAAAALESGVILKEYPCAGEVNVDGLLFHCYNGLPHGTVDLKGALAQSCNCYFINNARALGGQSILNMAYNLGLGAPQEFGRGLFSAAGSLPTAGELGNARALANFSFGQGTVTVTPLQLCGLVNAIAAEGRYSTPRLIAGTVDGEGKLSPSRAVSEISAQVMKPATARILQSCMEAAVREGTARPGAPANCTAGIKTGTAQTGVFENGEELLDYWYCGYIRGADGSPRYCITVLREGVQEDGGPTAKVFKTIAEGLTEMESASDGGQ